MSHSHCLSPPPPPSPLLRSRYLPLPLFLTAPPPPATYTLSLHDALPISADSYGPHVSEELIAEALHPYPAELLIATKGGFDRPGSGKAALDRKSTRLNSSH